MKSQIERQEGVYKSALAKRMKERLPGYVVLVHESVRRAGHPDWSITAHSRNSWIEFKHGTPHFDSQGLQELTMLRLAAAGFARYVIWQEQKDGNDKRTLIVHPRNIGTLEPELWCAGYDYDFLIDYFRKVHQP